MTHAMHPQQLHTPHRAQTKTASGLNFIAGIYLLISAWIAHVTAGGMANGIVFGIIVAILAASRFAGSTGPWASWLDALIGVWMILSPWVYGYADHAWKWNSIVVGIVMIVLGVWSALSTKAGEAQTG